MQDVCPPPFALHQTNNLPVALPFLQSCWADQYFQSTPVNKWDVVDYLRRFGESSAFDKLMLSWTKALKNIIEDNLSSSENKQKAVKLCSSYDKTSSGTDNIRARDWFKNRSSSPPVAITNSFTFTSSSRCSVQVKLPNGSDSDRPTVKRRSSATVQTRKKKKRRKSGGNITLRDEQLHERFTNSYNTMDNQRKWLLPGGEFVEDILHERFKLESQLEEHSAHSWVIDLGDPKVKSCFTDADWLHIREQMPPWPDNDPLLTQSLMRFEHVQTPTDLSTALENTSYFQDGDKNLDQEAKRLKYFGPRWVDVAIRQLLPLYEDPGHFKSKYNLENWFVVNIWSTFFDQCMMTVKEIHLSRGESQSMSSSNRKNPDPVRRGSRKKTGHRYDGVLRFNDIEIGAVEDSREYQGGNSRKWVSDSLKLVKVLHDMLVRLEPLIHSEDAFRSLPVVGLVTAGLHCQPIQMKYAKGYICLLSRHELRQVPTALEDSGDLFALLLDFWRMRTLVQQCKTKLQNLKTGKREQFFEQLKSSSTLPPRVPLLLPSIDTDAATDDDGGGDDDTGVRTLDTVYD